MARTISLRARQSTVLVLLFTGYAACYFCRADLSVATPLIIEELGQRGITHAEAIVRIGEISSFGVLAYALGKLFLGGLGDFWGGKPNFLIALGGAAAFTLLFAGGATLPVFTLAWIGNRITQSIGWAGLIKVSSKWFDYSAYGTVLGILSVSYLVGDAGARYLMGLLIQHGFGWRSLFVLAASVVGTCFLASLLFLRESRALAGHGEARANPLSLYGDAAAKPASVASLLRPLFRSRAFIVVCVLSFGCTVVRETFNTWTPAYLREYLGYSMSGAASWSAVFPGVGAASVIASGWASDRLGVHGRSLLLFLGLAAAAAALLALMTLPASTHASLLPVLAIAVIAFCLLGPYSYLGGAIALDFGGKQAGAVSSGIIDGVGYLGGVLAGASVAQLSVAFGWRGVFIALAAVSALSALGAAYLYLLSIRAARSPRAAGG